MRLMSNLKKATPEKIKQAIFSLNLILILLFSIIAFTNVKYQSLFTKPDAWKVKDTFVQNKNPLDKSKLQDVKQLIDDGIGFWSSYAGSANNTGLWFSAPFRAPAKLTMMIAGYPLHPHNQLYLEQIETGEKFFFASFNPGTRWARIDVEIPESMRQTRIRLVALDNGKNIQGWLGLSAPYKIRWWAPLRPYTNFYFAFAFLLLLIPGFIPSSLFGYDLRSFFYWTAIIGLCLILFNFRYVCAQPEKMRTTILFGYLFCLTAPCFYICFRILLPKFLGVFLFIFFLFFAFFPYEFFFDPETILCNYYLYSDPQTVIGLPRYWIVILYGFFAMVITSCWWWYKKKKYSWILPKREIAVSLFLLLLVLLQTIPRLDDQIPIIGSNGEPPYCESTHRVNFFGHCVTVDVYHHTITNGMYKGVRDKFRNFCINRRALGPFLFSLLEPYTDPYYAAIIINGFFFYLILLAGYALTIHLNLSKTVAILYVLLLSSNYFLHNYTNVPAFYLGKTAFALLILAAGNILRVFTVSASLKSKLLFCSILACSSIIYDPYITVTFVFLWAFFQAKHFLKQDAREAAKIFSHGVCYCIVPMLSLFMLEMIFKYFGLQGNTDNIASRTDIFNKLYLLPGYIFNHPDKIYQTFDNSINRLIFNNPRAMEYITLLGSFGIISLFVFIPKHINAEKLRGIYALFLATILIPTLAMLAGSIPPLGKYYNIYLHESRTSDYLSVLILAQAIGIYHISKNCYHWFPHWINEKHLSYSAGFSFFLLSYCYI